MALTERTLSTFLNGKIFIGSIGILKMSMMKSDEELCERKANIDGMDQG